MAVFCENCQVPLISKIHLFNLILSPCQFLKDSPLTFGILPWNQQAANPYQQLMAAGMENIGLRVERLSYHPFSPISKAIESSSSDVLVLDWVHSFYTSPSLISTLLKTWAGVFDRRKILTRTVPIIWNIHNLHRHDNRHRRLERWSFRQLARTVDGIRVFNQNSVPVVREYFDVPAHVPVRYIPHGNYRQITGHDPALNLPGRLGVEPTDFVLLLPGEIREGKGVISFIKSFCACCLPNSEVKLVVAGRPQNTALVEELTAAAIYPNVILHLNHIPDGQWLNFLELAHFVVLPYERILNSGMALLALGAGKPLLASECFAGQFPENIALTGPLAKPAALGPLISRARRLDREQMRLRALEFSKSRDWDTIAVQLRDFGQELLAKYSKPPIH